MINETRFVITHKCMRWEGQRVGVETEVNQLACRDICVSININLTSFSVRISCDRLIMSLYSSSILSICFRLRLVPIATLFR